MFNLNCTEIKKIDFNKGKQKDIYTKIPSQNRYQWPFLESIDGTYSNDTCE